MILFGWLRAMESLENVVAGKKEALPVLPPEVEEPREEPEGAGAAQQAAEQHRAGGSSGGAILAPGAGTACRSGQQRQRQGPLPTAGRKRSRG